jgi:cardiolipin synthase
VVGSTNLDFRSFRFNGECNLVMLDRATARTMADAFREDLTKASEILPAEWRRRPLAHRVGDRLARSLAPLL